MSEMANLTSSVSKLEEAVSSLLKVQKKSMFTAAKSRDITNSIIKRMDAETKALKIKTHLELKAQKRKAKIEAAAEAAVKDAERRSRQREIYAESQRLKQEALNKINEEEIELSLTRSQVASKLTKTLEEQGREFNILSLNVAQSVENFREFAGISGAGKLITGMEYLDLLLTGTSQKIKIFGIEATTARRVMYGFLPPGMFRLVNKFSTGLRFTSGALRALSGEAEESNNMFSMLGKVWRKTLGFKPGKLFEIDLSDEGYAKMLKKREKRAAKAAKKIAKANRRAEHKAQLQAAKDEVAAVRNKTSRLTQELLDRRNLVRDAENEIIKDYKAAQGKRPKVFGSGQERVKREKARTKYDEGLQKKLQEGRDTGKLGVRIRNRDKKSKSLKKQGEELAKAQAKVRANTMFRKKLNKIMKGAGNLMKSIGGFIRVGLKFFFMTMFYIVGIIALIAILGPSIKKGIEKAWKSIQPTLTFIWEMIELVWEGFMDLWDAAFNGGGFEKAIQGVLKIVGGLLGVLGGIVFALGQFLAVFIYEFLIDLYGRVKEWLIGYYKTGNKIAKTVLLVLVIIGVAIGIFLQLPVLVIVGIAAVIYGFGKWFLKSVDLFSKGGVSSGGPAIVGEKGPELVNLPAGSRVHSNKESKKMVSAKGDNITNNFHITINARDTSDKELKRITDKIGKEIANKLNRRLGSPGFI
mgnify:CR=1 FL=1